MSTYGAHGAGTKTVHGRARYKNSPWKSKQEISAPAHADGDEAAAASWSSRHYDVGRSVYWYLCTRHLAYFIQPGMLDLSSNYGEIYDYQGSSLCYCEPNLAMAYEGNASMASAPSCLVEENGPSLPSGWVEDFLIDCYLGGAFSTGESKREELCMDYGVGEEPTFYESSAVDVETPSDTPALCSKPLQQENEDSCLHESERKEGFGEATEEDKSLLEAWQAQYGQVVRSDVEAQLCPQAINLWNWNTFELKGKGRSKSSICLLGQLAQTPGRLHPSSEHQNGFMKTTRICEVNLDLVKVLSGEIYRLRQPSSHYLSSVAMYDSSNPTKGWDLPCLIFSGLEDIEGKCASSSSLKLSIVTKPFEPNLRHHRYQQPNKGKIATPAIPASLRALSRYEIDSIEERKRKYRDRAKERREVHGVDAEQKCCSLSDDTNSGWGRESNRHLAAQRMLERMGWCEGEGLGKRKDGLKEPLNETSKRGRAGIGWLPCSLLLNKK